MPDAMPPDDDGLSSARLRELFTAAAETRIALGRSLGLREREIVALGHVAYAPGPVGIREIRERLGLSAAATTELVDRLVTAGHLERARSSADRRTVQVRMTDDTRRLITLALTPLTDSLDDLIASLAPDARRTVDRFLRAATDVYAAYRPAPATPPPTPEETRP